MVAAYVLICTLPVALILLVFAAIVSAAMRTYRAGKRMHRELNPYLKDLSERSIKVQRKALEFGERLNDLSGAYEEIGGRLTFIADGLKQIKNSPVVKIADRAGRLSSRKRDS